MTARLFPARPLVALWLSPTGIVACILLADQATVAALAAENAKLAAQVPGLQTAMKTTLLPPLLPPVRVAFELGSTSATLGGSLAVRLVVAVGGTRRALTVGISAPSRRSSGPTGG